MLNSKKIFLFSNENDSPREKDPLMIGVANSARHRDQYNPESAAPSEEYQIHFQRMK